MNVETLHDLFLFELQGLYYVETELADELAELADQADVNSLDDRPDADLRDALTSALTDHRSETETHVQRLEDAFATLDRQPEPREDHSLDGLLTEKDRFVNVVLNDAARLPFFLDVARKAERIEIRSYESAIENARALGAADEVIDALEANLAEERAALEELTELAESDGASELREGMAEESPEA